MALAHAHIRLLLDIRRLGLTGSGQTNSILEFGEQNWFGDVAPAALGELIESSTLSVAHKLELRAALTTALANPSETVLFDIAKIFYRLIFEHQSYTAVDLHGTPAAHKFDINEPLPLEERFDVVTNIGTTEHVFNQYQAFKSIHELTKPKGLMIHSLPNQGCFDHGFYNYHPTFFFDLCEANGYELPVFVYADATQTPNRIVQLHTRADYVKLAIAQQLSPYSGLFAVAKKGAGEAPFKIPRQGYYDNRLPAELAEAWRNLPR